MISSSARTSDWKLWLIIGFISITGSVVSQEENLISLTPAYKEVERYLDDSHIVSCKSPRGLHMMWTRNMTNQITASKGKVHIERPAKDSLSLVFESIESKDKGNYTCTATVDGQTVHATFRLVVIKPIKFLDTLTVQTANVTQNVVVRCEVDGDPEPAIMWSVKGKTPDGPKYKVVADGLYIDNVSLSDMGEYHCRAFQLSRVKSNMLERTIMLKIQHKPMWNGTERTEKAYGFLKGHVNLTCDVSAEPSPKFLWLKENNKTNKTIPVGDNYTVIDEGTRSTLLFQITNENAFGDYVCRATNSLGKMEKKISVLKGSKPNVPSMSIDGITPESVKIDIEIAGNEELEILGYRVQYIRKEDDWEDAEKVDFDAGSLPYVLGGLQQNTEYSVRVAARNIAGFSDYTEETAFTTEKIHADPVTGSTGTATYISSKASQLLVVITLHIIIYITGDLKHNL